MALALRYASDHLWPFLIAFSPLFEVAFARGAALAAFALGRTAALVVDLAGETRVAAVVDCWVEAKVRTPLPHLSLSHSLSPSLSPSLSRSDTPTQTPLTLSL